MRFFRWFEIFRPAKKDVGSKHEAKWNDVPVANPKDDDLVIAIVGAPGAGKSTFINTLLGQTIAPVGHGLTVQTTHFQHFDFNLPDRRVVIVDTPPLEFAYPRERDDYFARLKSWLTRSYNTGAEISGVIVLHEISSERLSVDKGDFRGFENLCGRNWPTKVAIVTTKWNKVSEDIGKRREDQLKNQYWKDMLDQGSIMHRVDLTQDSATRVVDSIIHLRA